MLLQDVLSSGLVCLLVIAVILGVVFSYQAFRLSQSLVNLPMVDEAGRPSYLGLVSHGLFASLLIMFVHSVLFPRLGMCSNLVLV